MLKERQKSILKTVILEHIRTARPVSSQELLRGSRLDVSPATIRNEMFELDELGYLEQPHTSAGRVPTDKGYRFFVDYLIGNNELGAREQAMLEGVFEIKGAEEFLKEFTKTLSELSGTFAAAGLFDDDVFYETGFSEMLEEPEMHDVDSIRRFGRLADLLDEEMRSFFVHSDAPEQIFIGQENPMKDAHECAMIISSWQHPRGFGGFLTMIGPKRTNYPKHKALLDALKNL